VVFDNRVKTAGDQPVFRFGEVISVEDPYRMFRAQVRVFGMTDDKRGIPDEDLPWYVPMFPITSPSLAGAGQSSGLEEGSKVLVLIMDYPSCQHGFIMGSHYPGPSSPSHVSPLAKGLLERGPELPKGPGGSKIDLGLFGNIGIVDIANNAFSMFSKLFDLAKIFRNLNIFKVGEK
jgi:hypothetical protein